MSTATITLSSFIGLQHAFDYTTNVHENKRAIAQIRREFPHVQLRVSCIFQGLISVGVSWRDTYETLKPTYYLSSFGQTMGQSMTTRDLTVGELNDFHQIAKILGIPCTPGPQQLMSIQ